MTVNIDNYLEATVAEQRFDGQSLKQALKSAEAILKDRIEEVNALNVYPVPDGDTGINMYLTMQSATAAVESLSTASVAEISAKAARGALMGARGNSGVILSQIFRGLAKGLEMKEYVTSLDFAQALRRASDAAYQSISEPVEGTILTVMREASEAAMREAARGADLKKTITAAVSQARNAVKRTPELLPRLKEAGVVDAGGKGLYYIFLGMKEFVSDKMPGSERRKTASSRAKVADKRNGYGTEIQFLVEGDDLPLEEMREQIGKMGESVLVVGDAHLIRVHVHTRETQPILDYSSTKGRIRDVAIQQMDEQVKAFKRARSKPVKTNGKS